MSGFGPHAPNLLPGLLFGLGLALFVGLASAGEPCRIAFDMGSSGIRAGQSGQPAEPSTDIDYLTPLMAGRGLGETLPATAAALRELPERNGFDPACKRMGGGFSAWRLAAQQNRAALATALAGLQRDSGTAVLVIPQRQEGAYGYRGAQALLGERLQTRHILDIGGGSLQIAGEHNGFGALFGQKLWHRKLCQALRGNAEMPCALQPMQPDELATARALVRRELAGVTQALPQGTTMTAISRPVTRGVGPAVARYFGRPQGLDTLSPAMLRATLEQHAGRSLAETAERLGTAPRHAAYLISDMILVEGLLEATGNHDLRIAEIDLTNLPGLLADDRAYRWAARYDCYLDRLRRQGTAAYDSDPRTCRAPEKPRS